jgi:hypothetical protein
VLYPLCRASRAVLLLALAIVVAVTPLLTLSTRSHAAAWPSEASRASSETAPTAIDRGTPGEAEVNELGVIPVLMYHAFTTAGSNGELWSRTIDEFRSDLLRLYESDFYVISIRDLLNNTIDVPLGKHPVVLTFDDSSAGQFQFMENDRGELVPTPDSAVGVLEAFFADHPDFGKSGHFAVVPTYCFAEKDKLLNTWDESCGAKLQWLSDHGYEVGNHTWTHQNLNLTDGFGIAEQVGLTTQFIDERVTGPGNLSRVLTLPYGESPAPGTEGAAHLANGFQWSGEEIVTEAMLKVSGGPAYSPSSSWWNPMAITRFNTDQASLDYWFGSFERRDVILYTSDGNANTVTIPDPLPEYLQNEFDPSLIAGSGKALIRHTVAGAKPLTELPYLAPGTIVCTTEEGVRLRATPSLTGDVIRELKSQTTLTILDGPVEADGYIWWHVSTDNANEGWVVVIFLAGPPGI